MNFCCCHVYIWQLKFAWTKHAVWIYKTKFQILFNTTVHINKKKNKINIPTHLKFTIRKKIFSCKKKIKMSDSSDDSTNIVEIPYSKRPEWADVTPITQVNTSNITNFL